MTEQWRLILQKDTSAAYGLAVDEATALSVSRNNSPPILHLYNFLPCVVLGRYQSAEDALDLEACRNWGLEVNRRHTGGGTVMMGPKQLALGFSIPKNYTGAGPSINHLFKNLGGVLCKALAQIGIRARYRPKNDLEVGGKKIAGLSASLEERDVAFFHTSLLLDFDIKLMLKVFKLPIKKLSDKHISCFAERMTTVRKERRRKFDLPSFQSIVRKAFEEHFGVVFRIDTLNQWELEHVEMLLRHRYTNPEWIYSKRHPKVGMGFASAKTRGGLLQVGVTLAGGVMEAVCLSGDFLSTGPEINAIESALRYCRASKREISKKLRGVVKAGTIFKVDKNIIAKLALKAAEQVRLARRKAKLTLELRKKQEAQAERKAKVALKAKKKREAQARKKAEQALELQRKREAQAAKKVEQALRLKKKREAQAAKKAEQALRLKKKREAEARKKAEQALKAKKKREAQAKKKARAKKTKPAVRKTKKPPKVKRKTKAAPKKKKGKPAAKKAKKPVRAKVSRKKRPTVRKKQAARKAGAVSSRVRTTAKKGKKPAVARAVRKKEAAKKARAASAKGKPAARKGKVAPRKSKRVSKRAKAGKKGASARKPARGVKSRAAKRKASRKPAARGKRK